MCGGKSRVRLAMEKFVVLCCSLLAGTWLHLIAVSGRDETEEVPKQRTYTTTTQS